ncbi:MAG: peptidyl-prolyl cis-trans isomerase [Deltaproteobacteria bacterium]|nr:peptidyl-prolyl cis-trans isomerase [Deltaproteobacteria bacterium]
MNSIKVVLDTSKGAITLELWPDRAPKTVASFVDYVKSGQYDGTIFHRVIDNFMLQGGGFDVKQEKRATKAPIQNEANNGLKNDLGTVAMARTSDPHSATCQFFINVKNNDFLNHTSTDASGWGYCVFGKVTSGMDVVNAIKSVKTGPKGQFAKDVPVEDVIIRSAKLA